MENTFEGNMDLTDKTILELPHCNKLCEIDPNIHGYLDVVKRRWQNFERLWNEIEAIEPDGIDGFTRSYETYGIHARPDGSVYCREWCPAAEQISLYGEFNNWRRVEYKFTSLGGGLWELVIPSDSNGKCIIPHESIIKLLIVNKDEHYQRERISPWAHFAVPDNKQVLMQSFWNPPEHYKFIFPRPSKPDRLRIYESHVGISSPEFCVASYRNYITNVLPRIQDLGYNTIQLMAIMEHGYYASFGYQVTNFFAASSRYGNPNELKELIDTAHKLGLIVLLDIIHSHASSNILDGLNEFDGTDHCFFHGGDRGTHQTWTSKLFNYGKKEVIRFLLSNLRWWIDEYHFDGFRFDGISSMVYNHHCQGMCYFNYDEYYGLSIDTDAVTYLMLANHFLHSYNPSFMITIAEEWTGMPHIARPVDEGGYGFDYRQSMGGPDEWVKIVNTSNDFDFKMSCIVWMLINRRHGEKHIAYVESHDQALVGKKSLAFWLMEVDMYEGMSLNSPPSFIIDRGISLHKMIRLIVHTLGGEGYLNFTGNEFGHPEWLDFPRAENLENYLFARRQWNLADDQNMKYQFLNNFDRDMNRCENEYGWLNSPQAYVSRKDEEDKVIVYDRAGLCFVFNFHPYNSYNYYKIGVPREGRYQIILDTDRKRHYGLERLDHSVIYQAYPEKWDGRDNHMMIDIPNQVGIVFQSC